MTLSKMGLVSTEFLREERKMVKKYHQKKKKKSSLALTIGQMQIKARSGNDNKEITDSKRWRGCGERGSHIHCWWDCKL